MVGWGVFAYQSSKWLARVNSDEFYYDRTGIVQKIVGEQYEAAVRSARICDDNILLHMTAWNFVEDYWRERRVATYASEMWEFRAMK